MKRYNSLLRGIELITLLQAIVENAPIGIYTINHNGAIDFTNPKFIEMSGDSEEQLIGLNAFTLPTYKKYGLYPYIIQGLAGKPFEIELQYISYFGKKETYRHYVGIPLPTTTNEIEHLLLLVEDITEKKQLEMKIQTYTKNLEQQVTNLKTTTK